MKLALIFVLSLAKRVLFQIVRDKQTLLLLLLIPTTVNLLFGYALESSVTNIKVGLVDDDQGLLNVQEKELEELVVELEKTYNLALDPDRDNLTQLLIERFATFTSLLNLTSGEKPLSQILVQQLEEDQRLTFVEYKNWDEAKEGVNEGEVELALRFGTNFTVIQLLTNFQDPMVELQVYTNPTSVQTQLFFKGILFDTFLTALRPVGFERYLQFQVEVPERYKDPLQGFTLAVPSSLPFVLNFLLLLTSSLILVRENTQNTWQRIVNAPVTKYEVVLGYAGAMLLVALASSLVVFIFGFFVFGSEIRGSPVLLILSLALYSLTFIFMALGLKPLMKNEFQTVQIASLVTIPSIILSGAIIPLEYLSPVIRPLSYVFPMTYGVLLLDKIVVRGYGLELVWKDFLALGFVCLVMLGLALRSYRTED